MRKSLSLVIVATALGCSHENDGVHPRYGPITEAVYASGTVKAVDQYNAYATATGILSEVLVKEGDSVRAGQPLLVIDDRAASLSRRNAELALELSSSNAGASSPLLKERAAAAELAREKARNDSLLFERQRALWEQRIGSRNDYEQRELAFQSSRTNYLNAVSALEDARSRLRNELELARNNYAKSQVGQGDFTVRSLVDGRVFDVLIEKGELVTPQKALAVLGRANAFVLELQVDEQDLPRVRPGQRVAISMDSYAGQVFEAEVSHIDPILDQRSRTFTVKATFTRPPPDLYPFLTVEANIIVATKPHVLTVPTDHLINGRYVITKEKGRVEVTTGLHGLQRTEVLGGIDSTTTLLKP